MQIDSESVGASADTDGLPRFRAAGSRALGEFLCADCGYGVVVRALLPECPMCRGRSWEEPATSPYGRVSA